MQEVTFKFDFDNVIISNDFSDYFLSLTGIKNINYKNDDYLEITIQYTDDISLERIKLELELYFNILNIPEMLFFDKHIKNTIVGNELIEWIDTALKEGSGRVLKAFSESLFMKRIEFAHEKEVRFIIDSPLIETNQNMNNIFLDHIDMEINPYAFIEEIALDPRLTD